MKLRLVTFLLAASATTLAAQHEEEHKEKAEQEERHQMMDHGVVKAATPLYETVRGYVVKSAEQMPEADYSFKPTPEVRSFGQLIGHLANSAYFFCSAAMGEDSPNATNLEESVSGKAALVEALTASMAYCDKAYEMSDAKAVEKMEFFGNKGNRLYVLNFNVAHNFEHYGNIVTYLRMKGLVPPSSQRGQ